MPVSARTRKQMAWLALRADKAGDYKDVRKQEESDEIPPRASMGDAGISDAASSEQLHILSSKVEELSRIVLTLSTKPIQHHYIGDDSLDEWLYDNKATATASVQTEASTNVDAEVQATEMRNDKEDRGNPAQVTAEPADVLQATVVVQIQPKGIKDLKQAQVPAEHADEEPATAVTNKPAMTQHAELFCPMLLSMPNLQFQPKDEEEAEKNPDEPLEVAISSSNPDDPLEVATSSANPDEPLEAPSANPDETLEAPSANPDEAFAIACAISCANYSDECLSQVIKHFQEEFDKVPLTQHRVLLDTLTKEEARRIKIKQIQETQDQQEEEVPALPPDTFELQVFNNHFVVFWLLLKAVIDILGGSSSLNSFLLMIGIIAML